MIRSIEAEPGVTRRKLFTERGVKLLKAAIIAGSGLDVFSVIVYGKDKAIQEENARKAKENK